jgi:hypothetical protein
MAVALASTGDRPEGARCCLLPAEVVATNGTRIPIAPMPIWVVASCNSVSCFCQYSGWVISSVRFSGVRAGGTANV